MTPPTDEARAGEPRPSTEAGRALVGMVRQQTTSHERLTADGVSTMVVAIERDAATSLDVAYADLAQMVAVGWPATSHEYRAGYRAALDRLSEKAP